MDPEERGWQRLENVAPLLGVLSLCWGYLKTSRGQTALIFLVVAAWSLIDPGYLIVSITLVILIGIDLASWFREARMGDQESGSIE